MPAKLILSEVRTHLSRKGVEAEVELQQKRSGREKIVVKRNGEITGEYQIPKFVRDTTSFVIGIVGEILATDDPTPVEE